MRFVQEVERLWTVYDEYDDNIGLILWESTSSEPIFRPHPQLCRIDYRTLLAIGEYLQQILIAHPEWIELP